MQELLLTDEIVDRIKVEAIDMVKDIMGVNLVQVILYGSCARGDFTDDSDIDMHCLLIVIEWKLKNMKMDLRLLLQN